MEQNYRKNENLNSETVKKKILNYLYQHIDRDILPAPIKNKEDLDKIKNDEYIVCPEMTGVRSWVVIFNINNSFYAVNFPKNKSRKQKTLNIYPINIQIEKSLYHGTIMEGIYYEWKQQKYWVIDEVYFLSGDNQLLKQKDERLLSLQKVFTTQIVHDQRNQFYVCEFFYPDKADLEKLHLRIKGDSRIQNIIFYPKIFGRKIYFYTIMTVDLVDNIINTNIFLMKKTKSPDVYFLFDEDKKIGIAHIPDRETSARCKNWFKENKKKTELMVVCQKDNQKNKWIPIKLADDENAHGADSEVKDQCIQQEESSQSDSGESSGEESSAEDSSAEDSSGEETAEEESSEVEDSGAE